MRFVFVLFVSFSLFLKTNCFKNNTNNLSCLKDLKKVVDNFSKHEKWALQIIDSSGKIPSGIIEGNLVDLGHFQQCIKLKHNDINGKYCVVKIPFGAERNMKNNVKSQVESIVFQRSIDPNLILGLCVPDSCTIKDIISVSSLLLNSTLSQFKSIKNVLPYAKIILDSVPVINALPIIDNTTYLEILFNKARQYQHLLEEILISEKYSKIFDVAEEICQTDIKINKYYSTGDAIVIFLIGLICVIILISTYCEITEKFLYKDTNTFHNIFMCFSLKTNVNNLLKDDKHLNKIHCIDGLRVVSIMWVIIGHIIFIYFTVPEVNPGDMIKWINKWHSKLITSADLAVDTFLVISGFLISYLTMKTLERGIKLNISLYYLYRYLRITPSVVMIILATVTIIDNFGVGPFWPVVMQEIKRPCLDYWWANILYINNYINFNNKCLGPTWYLSLDMQLYILSPLLILTWKKWPKFSHYLNIVILFISISIPIYYSWIYELPTNMLLMKNYDYLEYYYHATECRYGPWFIGLLTGYYSYNNQIAENEMKKDKCVNYKFWILCFILILLNIFGQQYLFMNEYNKLESSIFNGVHRHFWAIIICWIIYTCKKGNGGIINEFLSNYYFKILARLSYSIYLMHFFVLTLIVGQMESAFYFSDYNMFKEFISVFIITTIIAVLFYLMIEVPVSNIIRYFFKNKKKRKKSDQSIKGIVINNLSKVSSMDKKQTSVNIFNIIND